MKTYQEELKNLYDSTWRDTKEHLQKDSYYIDTVLHEKSFNKDERIYYTSVFIIRDKEIIKKFNEIKKLLCEVEPDQYFYSEEELHITILTLMLCKKRETSNVDSQINTMISCIKDISKEIKPFNINLKGICATKDLVFIKGFFNQKVQDYRDKIVQSFEKYPNIEVQKYHRPSWMHLALMRFSNNLNNKEDLINTINKLQNLELGEITVDEIQIYKVNKYFQKEYSEKIGSIKL